MESRPARSPSPDVEWTAQVRGRTVRCWWRDEHFGGDDEVIERICHLPSDAADLTTLEGARTAVLIVLLDPVERAW